MMPHFSLLLGVSLLAFFAQNRRYSQGLTLVFWVAVVIILTLFAGLRADSVGADTIAYVNRYLYLVSIDAVWDAAGSAEPGHKALFAIARLVSESPTTGLLVTSGAAAVLYVTAIYRLTAVPSLALFVFIAFGFYVFHMNGLRQGLALGVYLHALPSLLSGRPMRYVLWVLAASMFHVTAIVALPMYFFFRAGLFAPTIALLIGLSSVAVVGLNSLWSLTDFLDLGYARYRDRQETGGTMLTAFYVILSAVFIFGRPIVRVDLRSDYDKFLLMLLFGTMIYLIVLITGSYVELNRLALYFTVSIVFLWPILMRSIPNEAARLTGIVLFIFGSCLYYYIFLDQIGGYVPYMIR
jgi:hypothetical protein